MKNDDIKIPGFMQDDYRIQIDPSMFEDENAAMQKDNSQGLGHGRRTAKRKNAGSIKAADKQNPELSGKQRKEDKAGKRQGIKQPKESGSKERSSKDRRNRPVLFATWFFVILFFALIINYSYFIYYKSDAVVNNSYNQRQELLADAVCRGEIRSADGQVLAKTDTLEDGSEVRTYPFGNLFCHVVGRVEHGKTGIEGAESISLLTCGTNLFSRFETQLKGEKLKGNNVITTLDVDLTKVASQALGNQKGAVVAIEPSTGKILAMVSKSDYDPNHISQEWDKLSADTANTPLLNRATQGLYPPGSSFKILTALAYAQQHSVKRYSFDCKGKGIFSSVTIHCYNESVHGTEDIRASFAHSCNTSFANMGTKLDLTQFRNLCNRFYFNQELPTQLASEKSRFVLSADSDKSEVPQTAIGQGNTQITPLHNAMIAAAIANDGMMMKPYVVDRVETANGATIVSNQPEQARRVMKKKEAKWMNSLMEEVVQNGTATQLSYGNYTAAGKTGSAEFNSSKDTHAWFVGYARSKDSNIPEIAISVLVENSGTGGVYAVPVAAKIFDAFFS